MSIFELAAIGAAICWALASLISREASQHLGALGFNRARMIMVFAMLGAWGLFSGGFQSIETSQYELIVISGFVGIFLGDTALFLTMNRLGPRRTSILFSLNAPISALLGWLVLGEILSIYEVLGILIVFAGVILAVVFGKKPSQLHQWEHVKGSLLLGILLGITAALCQSVGSLVIKPIMSQGVDPIAVSALRVGVAGIGLSILMRFPSPQFKLQNPMTARIFGITAVSGFLGMAAGMTLILFALSGGEVGIISTLSATSPVILLPMLWIKTKEMPAYPAWIGAGLVVIGTGLIFT